MTQDPGNLVSLSRARKARARAARKAEADANALRFGRTKGERAAGQARADKSARMLDALRRDTRAERDPSPGKDPVGPPEA
jgi:phage protein D